jgi:predicted nucleic acid-binding protein
MSKALYLLDSNVVSELRKASSGKADPNVVQWASTVTSESLCLSVISIMEIQLGIRLLARRDPVQAELLRRWFSSILVPTFGNRILHVDVNVALACASLHVPDPRPERDALIAATALVHGACLVTRNPRDFQNTGLTLVDPWVSPHPLRTEAPRPMA